MREIKFRAWDKVNNKMILECGEYKQFAFGINYQKDIEFMQYTGLEDKNGKEIYEGDIVFAEDDVQGNIEWLNQANQIGWKIIDIDKTTLHDIRSFANRHILERVDLEIIGNIYETPHI